MKSRVAWRISCIYAGFGEAWILASSALVWLKVGEPPNLASLLEMGKGSAFILVTSVLLFILLHRWEEEIDRRDKYLRQSEARYRLLHESLRDGFGQVTMDGKFLDCNAVYCDMLGYSRSELLKLSYHDLTPQRWHGMEGDIITMTDIFAFEQTGVEAGKIIGRLRPTGLRPKFMDKIEAAGINLPPSIFGVGERRRY